MATMRLHWLGAQSGSAAMAALEAACTETVAAASLVAKQRAPVDTGHLMGTIEFIRAQRSGDRVTGYVGNWTAHYAIFVELGTYKMRAQPYLRPAGDIEFPRFPARVAARMRGF